MIFILMWLCVFQFSLLKVVLFVALDLSDWTQTSSPQLSGTKKEKDGEDKKRNPILKYIGKPRTTSQSSKLNSTNTFDTLEEAF